MNMNSAVAASVCLSLVALSSMSTPRRTPLPTGWPGSGWGQPNCWAAAVSRTDQRWPNFKSPITPIRMPSHG
ncbi:hypothetical protein ABIA33_002366 [Streptacidiphilus sp. MAP12-16]